MTQLAELAAAAHAQDGGEAYLLAAARLETPEWGRPPVRPAPTPSEHRVKAAGGVFLRFERGFGRTDGVGRAALRVDVQGRPGIRHLVAELRFDPGVQVSSAEPGPAAIDPGKQLRLTPTGPGRALLELSGGAEVVPGVLATIHLNIAADVSQTTRLAAVLTELDGAPAPRQGEPWPAELIAERPAR